MNEARIIATGVDAGSTHTRCMISTVEDERLRFLGYGSVASKGWAKGRIADAQAVTACLHDAVVAAEQMAGVTVETVVAGIGGPMVRGANTRGHWDLNRPREITKNDITKAIGRATRKQLAEDRMILQILPQDFVVDDHPGFHDPRKMVATSLEANVHLVTGSILEHANLVGAVNNAHLSVDETVCESIAACYASVLPEDRKDGVVLLDIGQHSSELVCYYGESAQIVTTLRICGDHFSRDLAHALRLPIEEAAIVKEQFGSAVAAGTADNSVVELQFNEHPGRTVREAPRKLINNILESRAVELFEMVRAELVQVGMHRAITSGIVLSGGGALLAGICEVAERVLDCPARIGLAQGFLGWPEELQCPTWTTAAGLSMYAARLRTQVDVERQAVGVLGRILR
ncbi:MAG: cell division protein FtsA [Acidobacteriota bacterium]|nr:cell division protein FtsA [Acidobacteriota bacterium]